MKNWIVTICVLAVLASGCLPMAADIQNFSGEVQTLTSKIDDYQKEVTDITILLERDGVISEEIIKKIDKANEEINRVQPHVLEIAEAIKTADYVTGDDIGNLIKGGKAGVVAARGIIPAPYGDLALLLLGTVEVVTASLLRKKSGEAKTATTKLVKTEEGISKFQGTHDSQVAGELYDIIKVKTANI